MKIIILLVFVLLSALLISGCSDLVGQPNVQVQGECRGDWTLTKGCVYTCSGYAINSGNADAGNVEIEVFLKNLNTGVIRDSNTITVGRVGSGESKRWDITLDGECDQKYDTDLKILHI